MAEVKTPRFDRGTMRRAIRLLWMEYRVSEMAEVLRVNPQTIYRSWIPEGCPHRKDEGGAIWIVGTEFREWAEACVASRRKGHQPKEDER